MATSAILSLATVLLLYGGALGFSLLFDDAIDLTRVENRSYWSLLSSSEGYSYYRPLPFLLWKAVRQLTGEYHELILHALPLLAHAATGWLLFLLLRQFGAGRWAFVPALLFLTYPFHYQSVPIIGTLFHPLAGAAILGSLVLYGAGREARCRQRLIALVGSVALTLVALWSHESGVVVVPLVLGLELLQMRREGVRRPGWWALAHAAAGCAFVLVWLFVERVPFGEDPTIGELHPKALFFLQGFTYPFTAQIQWFEARTGLELGLLRVGLLAIVAGITAYAMSAWRTGRWYLMRWPLAGLIVAALAAAPSMARLTWPYVQNSPRLLYLVGIGAAIFWGMLPALSFGHRRIDHLWRAGTLFVCFLIVIQSWQFINVRLAMFDSGSQVVRAIVQQGEAHRGKSLLVVNAPSWLAFDSYEYPYGNFGVQVTPDYIGYDRVIYTSGEANPRVDVRSVHWNPDVTSGSYRFGPHGSFADPERLDEYLREGRTVIIIDRKGDQFHAREAGELLPSEATVIPNSVGRFGLVHLSEPRFVSSGLQVTLYFSWHVLEPPGSDYDAVLELRDGNDTVVKSVAAYPLQGMSAPRLWQAGDRVRDSITFTAPAAGAYTLWLGLREVGTGEFLPPVRADGFPSFDDLLQIGTVALPSPATALE